MNHEAALHTPPLTGTLLKDSTENMQPEDGLDLYAYWEIVSKHKWSILLVTLLSALIAFIYASSLEPRYRASATMLYNPPSASNYGTVQNLNTASSFNSYYQSSRMFKAQQLIVGSKSFVAKFVDHYELWDHPHIITSTISKPSAWSIRGAISGLLPSWLSDLIGLPQNSFTVDVPNTADIKERNRARAIRVVQSGLAVEIETEVMMLTVGFTSSSADFAQEIANKVSTFYSQYELDQRMETYNRANEWLVDRTKELRDQLMKSEQALQDFKAREDVGLVGGQDSINSKRLENIFTDLADARKRVQSLSQILSRLQRKNNNFSQIVDSDALLKFTGVRAAMKTEMELRKEHEQLALEFGPKHPNMINSLANLNRIQEKLNSEIQLVVVELRSDLNTARSDERRYNNELQNLKTQTQSLQDKTFQVTALERARDTDQQLYDLFVTRFKELNVGSSGNSSSINILNFAQVPGSPFWPNKSLIVALTSIFMFAVCIAFAFLQEYLDNTIKTPDEVEDKIGVPILGSLVSLEELEKGLSQQKAETFFVDQNKSPFAESIRTIRTGVMLSGLDKPHKIIAISSTVPGEGKTTVSLNLSAALGQLERVLLIDADMRKASIGPHLGLARNTKGLADVVAGLNDLSSCILHFKKGNIDVLPAGTLPPNPQELLSSDRFRQVIEKAAEKYDRIIIDTAPTHLVSDPKLVARWASAIIYVIRADSTPISIINQEVRELKRIGKPFIGAILNGISKKNMKGLYQYGRYRKNHGYGYGYDYGYGYGGDSITDKDS